MRSQRGGCLYDYHTTRFAWRDWRHCSNDAACARGPRPIIPIYPEPVLSGPGRPDPGSKLREIPDLLHTIEQVATGMRWAEDPTYFPEGGYLLFSDIPDNRIMKFDEKTGQTSVFRSPSNYANGNARDRQGRLVTREHSVTRRITRTEKNGKITVLADKFDGKRLNAPNDIVVKSDDGIWFTDPLFGINGEWRARRKNPSRSQPMSIRRPRWRHGVPIRRASRSPSSGCRSAAPIPPSADRRTTASI